MTTTAAAEERATTRMRALLPRLVDTQALIAQLQAEQERLLAQAHRIADDWSEDVATTQAKDAELPYRSVAAEIATAWRVSDRTVQRRMGAAAALECDYPETLDALAAGRISIAHVRVIETAGAIIDETDLRRAFEQDLLDYAENVSASRLKPVAARRAQWYAHASLADRHAHARAGRCVSLEDHDDGMSTLSVYGPSVLLHAAYDRLSQHALVIANASPDRSDAAPACPRAPDAPGAPVPDDPAARVPVIAGAVVPAADTPAGGAPGACGDPAHATGTTGTPETRGIDQIRADVFCDTLLTADPTAYTGLPSLSAITPIAQVTVPVLTLLDDVVADPFDTVALDGRVPIDADTARCLAAAAPVWDRILTHPITGHPLCTDRYRPTEQMRRHLRVRDQHCRFPGCRQPASRCDIDHSIDHAHGGPTRAANLSHLCRRHHTLKHHTRWSVRQRVDGELEWTSPTGRTYIDTPTSRVTFSTDPEHDPPPVEGPAACAPRTVDHAPF
ncbi:DUF222 domain-containing protein [Microbacterium sp.]|uniref:HNH endonuclease signature motif containing protein n=1 Tax=Microbacterium sp. TaxID=51671 RepID=UPI003A879C70